METVWVGVGFVLFFALLGYLGVHRTVLAGIDARGEKIAAELNEAKRLREEAEALLASFESKRKQAEADAAAIVAQAKNDAERMAQEAETKLAEFVKRRTAQAEQKIAQAEAQAAADVRAAAADAAVVASEAILRQQTTGAAGDNFVRAGLSNLKGRLN